MFAVAQNEEIFHKIFFKRFKENKVEIANAITKLFPFLESLRDRSLITDKIYADSQEACRNLVPVNRVVYHVLCHLEKSFDRPLVQALFSRVHLKEYPGLIEIHRRFEKVRQDEYCSQKTSREERQKTSNTQPSCEQGTGGDSVARSLTWSRSELSPSDGSIQNGPRRRTSEPILGVKAKCIKRRHSVCGPVPSETSTSQMKKKKGLEEAPSLLPRSGQGETLCGYHSACVAGLRKPRTVRSPGDEIIVISREDSKSSEEGDSTEASSSAPRREMWAGEEGEDSPPQALGPQAPELRSLLANTSHSEGAE